MKKGYKNMDQLLNRLPKEVLIIILILLLILLILLAAYALKLGIEPHLRIRRMFYPVLHKSKKSKKFKELINTYPNMQALISVSGNERDKVTYYIKEFSFLNNSTMKEVETSANDKNSNILVVLYNEDLGKRITKKDYKNLFNGTRIPADTRVDIWL